MENADCQMNSGRTLTVKESIIAARAFPGSGIWVVDNYNCLAALFALADTDRQPSELYLIARDDAEEDMPKEVFEEIAKIVKKCRISIRFVDSFLKPCSTATDRQRLQLLNDKDRFTFDRFYGYLDSDVITSPMMATLVSLGLAIKNATDAALVSSLRLESMNADLKHLNISVSSELAVQKLKPLNDSFLGKLVHLTFPYLTDECVNNVRPAINALTTGRGICYLHFPKSQLTAAGAWRLGFRLISLRANGVAIELCGNWKPDQTEKEDICDMFKEIGSVTEGVKWDVDWLYKESIIQR